ncbi:copper amine oxidase N-terminal domain-containing protein [Paenibacillus sp. IB182496]|uniref:Copper amine oxidase N-terminal domain-containing protein n=1 Tax=Paenibacillus sabuli TaxID=2772509 RepID=A0A927GTG3_9BACL|nr:copper amine oxidase N-terminal domain-containing protein [Paenibacillus sabuli]MBD2847548.1 copper amine oxidase N-terminal domain-containing protein [Paenibacillus sabuli]
MRKKWLGLVLGTALLSGAVAPTAGAAGEGREAIQVQSRYVSMHFDGARVSLPNGQYAFIHKGTTYIPLRLAANALQKQVTWTSSTRTVTLSEPTPAQREELREWLGHAAQTEPQPYPVETLTAAPSSVNLVVLGESVTLPASTPIYNVDGFTYVPLRFLSEAVGARIGWDNQAKALTAESPAYLARLEQPDPSVQPDESGTDGEAPDGEAPQSVPAPTPGGPGGNPILPGPAPGGGDDDTDDDEAQRIKQAAYDELDALRSACKSAALALGVQYLSADSAERERLLAEGQDEVAACTADFERIMASAADELEAIGHSAAILDAFRDEFEAELEAGRELVEQLAG